MVFKHKNLSEGRWREFSLMEQLGHIGSEISRANIWQYKDEKFFNGSVERALELFDLTLEDPRWRSRLREINRAREVFIDAIFKGKEYGSTLADIDRYFLNFALAARKI